MLYEITKPNKSGLPSKFVTIFLRHFSLTPFNFSSISGGVIDVGFIFIAYNLRRIMNIIG